MKRTFVASSRKRSDPELVDQRPVDRWLGVEVEVGQAPGRRQRGEPFEARVAPRLGGGDLDGEQAFEQRRVPEALAPRVLEDPRQGLGGRREAQRGEMAPEGLVERRLVHRDASTSSA